MGAAVKKEQAPVKYYEIVERKNSGFIMDGTGGTQYQQELNAPSIQWIPPTGKAAGGMSGASVVFKEVRYIKGCNTIDPAQQAQLGVFPKRFEDKIPMENGFATIVREGDSIGLYDYFEVVFYNADAKDRSNTATALFREVKLDKKAEDLLGEDEIETQAKMVVYELRRSTGKEKNPYQYNTDRINAICRLFNIYDETPERQLVLLLHRAKQDPRNFLEVVTKAEQTVITEVTHALELKVIKFDGNTAQYVDENKIIMSLGDDKTLKPIDKVEKFASWLSTHEGTNALTELRTKIELAKTQLLKG